MAFMEPEICRFSAYLISTSEGTEIIPAELADYVSGRMRHPADVRLVTGWYARLSAPGYLDCTDWIGPFRTKVDASEHLREMYPEDEEDEEDEEEV